MRLLAPRNIYILMESVSVKRASLSFLCGLLILGCMCWAQDQQPPVQPPVPSQPHAQPKSQDAEKKDVSPDAIIRQCSAKETEFYGAWKEYSYHQTAEVRVVSVNGVPKNEKMTVISDIVFKDDGTREVRVVRRAGDLHSVIFTREDDEIIDNLQPFALTDKELALYDLNYEGKEKIDELTCFVFAVKPKTIKSGRFYFEGKIWVDDQDLQIVRTVGKPVPQKKNKQLFPEFETIRQMIDGKYWFPVWTHADSQLHFQTDTIRIEETITYEDYKHFASKATIQFEPVKP